MSFAATFASHAWPVLTLIRGHFFVVGDFVRLKIFYSCFLTKYPRWLERVQWPERSTQWPVWETTPSVLIMRYLCIFSSVYLSFSILCLAKFKEFAGKKKYLCALSIVNWPCQLICMIKTNILYIVVWGFCFPQYSELDFFFLYFWESWWHLSVKCNQIKCSALYLRSYFPLVCWKIDP